MQVKGKARGRAREPRKASREGLRPRRPMASATKLQPLRNARTGSAASSKGRESSAKCAAISQKRKANRYRACCAKAAASEGSRSWCGGNATLTKLKL